MSKERASLFLAILAVSLTTVGCKGMAALGTIGNAVDAGPDATAPAVTSTLKLMIFGGTRHETYLGCLTCSAYAADSIWNKYGSSGSAYSAESIFNHYSQFGSKYSTESACNQYATDPPVIVDQNGTYYGRLTLNRYAPSIGIGTEDMGWLAGICE